MTKSAILSMLKANLEIINTLKDDYLGQLIDVSIKEINREGIVFVTTQVPVQSETDPDATDPDPSDPEPEPETEDDYEIDDANLIVMYAAYLYRNRVNDSEAGYKTAISATGMPRMLRYALNNRLFSQKMRTDS
jgi:hypothetical protein